jgi:hypothetical protein
MRRSRNDEEWSIYDKHSRGIGDRVHSSVSAHLVADQHTSAAQRNPECVLLAMVFPTHKRLPSTEGEFLGP